MNWHTQENTQAENTQTPFALQLCTGSACLSELQTGQTWSQNKPITEGCLTTVYSCFLSAKHIGYNEVLFHG